MSLFVLQYTGLKLFCILKLPGICVTLQITLTTCQHVGIVFFHYNHRPYTALRSQQLLQRFREMFDHPVYSPDLVPSYYHLLHHLKRSLPGSISPVTIMCR
ncbi:hypothetical protein AVEN_11515-1 [Araneus ventricosus]|uniref:Uncharacterized protein n=1 Tax=Araneus ventricosus TaxID=182803 RepID=A0A4Y2F1L2_ARAVE|nr:hypothetical protein AVEN_247376-1 [Araneus ventricosus]GBM35374.1 hypothetical protein AVEN_41409-1 [Araneus ventricosus]GBM35395.1 hypothetical protein AVEN_176714-1 [Araneus ventricosus]GBM35400.1 hypothetical protein AVEN_177360-1 [Araneus ventricosus]GBO27342.1 hypothetical protein AVEN_11515-1 [Araneus ventricosus]